MAPGPMRLGPIAPGPIAPGPIGPRPAAAAGESLAWPVLSWLLVLVPLISLGLMTWLTFTVDAIRTRSRLLGMAAAGYLGITTVEFALSTPTGNPGVLFGSCLAVTMFGGTAHALAVRGRVAAGRRSRSTGHAGPAGTVPATGAVPSSIGLPATGSPVQGGEPGAAGRGMATDPAFAAAVRRRERRAECRALLESDPGLAAELGVGRPDLEPEFDDGGLIDVNAVPAWVLAGLPGMNAELADRVVASRDRDGPLICAEDLVLRADAPLHLVESLRDRLLFRAL